eukprot:748415-Hanusia_phi.AAC.2
MCLQSQCHCLLILLGQPPDRVFPLFRLVACKYLPTGHDFLRQVVILMICHGQRRVLQIFDSAPVLLVLLVRDDYDWV